MLTVLERHSFVEAFDRDGVRGVLSVANGDLAPLHAHWGDTTLLGHLIGRDGTRFGRLSHAGLTELSLSIHELMAAIEAPSSAVEFRALAQSRLGFEFASQRLRPSGGAPRETAHLAAAGRSRRGSRSGRFDSRRPRRPPPPPDSTADYAEVVRLLAAAGDRPYLPGSLAVIQFRLPDVEPVTLADGRGHCSR